MQVNTIAKRIETTDFKIMKTFYKRHSIKIIENTNLEQNIRRKGKMRNDDKKIFDSEIIAEI